MIYLSNNTDRVVHMFWVYYLLVVLPWGTYEIVDKFAIQRVNALTATIYKTIFNTVSLPVLIYIAVKTNTLQWDLKAFWWCILSCVLTTVADYAFLVLISNKKVGWVAATTIPVGILLTVVLGVILFKEELTLSQILGAIIVVVGLYLLCR